MVPNIKNGSSFLGAGKYYMHDKAAARDLPNHEKPKTDERVSFMDTRNCLNDDPELALHEMWATAERRDALKMAAGIRRGGQPASEQVAKTISLSWHPSEKPTPEQMIEAADQFIAKMGWQEHQAVYIGHNDTAHPHIHIILNRVHPETGRMLDDRNDYKRAQAWGLEYEREQGRIFCEKRLETERARSGAERTPQAANENIPHHIHEMARAAELVFVRGEQQRLALDMLERETLKREQREERQAWFEDGAKILKAARSEVWREVREDYKPDWREFYRDKEAREAEAEAHSSSAIARATYFAKEGQWQQARAAFDNRDAVRDVVDAELAERRKALRAEQMEETRSLQTMVCDDLRAARELAYKDLLERQAAERNELRERHAQGERYERTPPAERAEGGAREVRATVADRVSPAPGRQDAVRVEEQHQIAAFSGPPPALLPAVSAPERGAEPSVPLELPPFSVEERAAQHDVDRAVTGTADLGAGMVGGAAAYLADQLAEAFAPTPVEQREAMAKAAAAREAEQESRKPVNPYIRHVGEAEQKARSEREEQERDRYWDDDRERRRER